MAYASSEKEFYQRHYDGALQIEQRMPHEETRALHYAPGKRYNLLLTELDRSKNYGTAVEVGCSDGASVFFLAQEFRFARVIGIDIGFPDEMHQHVQGVEFMHANFQHRLPLEDGSVDVFVAMMVIEHLFDPFQAFTEVHRLLSAEGKAFINLPLVTSFKNRLRLLFGSLPSTSVQFPRWLQDREWDGNHLHYFSMSAIEQLTAACGLEIVRSAGVGSNHRLKSMAPSFLASEISFVVRRKR